MTIEEKTGKKGLDNYQLAHIMANLYPKDDKIYSRLIRPLLKNEKEEIITREHNPEDTFPMHLIRWNNNYN
jgi:hypothetical protein